MSSYGQTSILDDLRQQFTNGTMVEKIILANCIIFLVVVILKVFAALFLFQPTLEYILGFFMVPAKFSKLALQPWSLITYMFFHADFGHIFFNMIVFYIFGKILYEFTGNRKILPIYMYGGLIGALVYVVSFNLFPAFVVEGAAEKGLMLGASAGVMAIMMAAVTFRPNYAILIPIVGPVKLKYIALLFLVLDLVGIGNLDNSGGHLAHLGGALLGFFFIKQLGAGSDWSKGFNSVADTLTTMVQPNNTGPRVAYKKEKASRQGTGGSRSRKNSDEYQAKIDAILDKISESGYDSLSKEEKEFLFKANGGGEDKG